MAKLFRIPTDFFNFLEESPIELSEKVYYVKLLNVANKLDMDTCLTIVNRIISNGLSELLIEKLIG